MRRPTREAYVRLSRVVDGRVFELGLEWRQDDSLDSLRERMAAIVRVCADNMRPNMDEMKVANVVAFMFVTAWPDRAYFIEVGDLADTWVQVYQPYGLPHND